PINSKKAFRRATATGRSLGMTHQATLTANSPTPTSTPCGKIAFVSLRDSNAEIYVMDANGSNQTRLTNNSADDEQPSFSPDGSKIAFFSSRDPEADLYNKPGRSGCSRVCVMYDRRPQPDRLT